MQSSSVRFRALATALGVVALVPIGCSRTGGAQVDDSAWSTRERSVSGEFIAASPREADLPADAVPDSGASQLELKQWREQARADSGDLRARSFEILEVAAKDEWALMRANAIEGLIPHPARLAMYVPDALVDENRGVRFVAAMAVGRARLGELVHLVAPLLADESDSVRAAAIFALAENGRTVDRSPLARMLESEDPEVRSNAIMILGSLGDPSAIPLIQSALGRGMSLVNPTRVRIMELQAAEAMVRLGDRSGIDPIRAALLAPPEDAELCGIAIQSVMRIRDERSVALLLRVADPVMGRERPIEIRLLAGTAAVDLGGTAISGVDPGAFLQLARDGMSHPAPQVRGQSAELLARLGTTAALTPLARLLADDDATVRVTAARAILASPSLGG